MAGYPNAMDSSRHRGYEQYIAYCTRNDERRRPLPEEIYNTFVELFAYFEKPLDDLCCFLGKYHHEFLWCCLDPFFHVPLFQNIAWNEHMNVNEIIRFSEKLLEEGAARNKQMIWNALFDEGRWLFECSIGYVSELFSYEDYSYLFPNYPQGSVG